MITPSTESVTAAVADRLRDLVLRAVADTLTMEGLRFSAREVRGGTREALVDAKDLLRALAGRRGASVEVLPASRALEHLLEGDVAGAVVVLAARDGKTASAWIVDAAKGDS